MNFRISIPIVFTVMLATLNSGTLLAQTRNRPAIAQLTQFRGKVELKREGSRTWETPQKDQNREILLYRGDLLRVQKGARGVIRCTSNSATWTIPDDGLPRGVANTCLPQSPSR